MNAKLRTALGVILGVFAGGLTTAAVEMGLHQFVEGDALFGGVALGFGLAAGVGSLVAGKVGRSRRTGPLIVGVIFAALAMTNLFLLPHPVWFAPVALLLIALGTWLGLQASGPDRPAMSAG